MTDWIDVTKELPKKDSICLAWMKDCEFPSVCAFGTKDFYMDVDIHFLAKRDYVFKGTAEKYKITHWAYIDKPE